MLAEFKFLEGMGIHLVPVAIIMTIIFSWLFMFTCKDFLKTMKWEVVRVLAPLSIGVIVYLFYVKSQMNTPMSWAIGWDAMVNGFVSVGLYSKVKSFLMSKGFKIGKTKKEMLAKKIAAK